VGESVWANVWDSVGDSVWDSVRASVWDSVRASVGDSVRASVGASVRESVGDNVSQSCYGQHDANWLAFYEYFKEVLDLKKQTEKLSGLLEIANHAGWFLPHEKICWISERPCVLMLDDLGQIHCENGPAIMYPDGWSIFATHGVRHEGWFVLNPELITTEKIAAESNIEIRRIMIDKMGHTKYLHETGAQVIDVDYIPIGAGIEGSIMRALLKDKNELVYLCGHDGSTDRVYYMNVDSNSKTCMEAHKSICGFDESLIIANA
jgi:uncharacterized protein DUF6745